MILPTPHNYIEKSTDNLKSKMRCLRKYSITFQLFWPFFRFENAFIELRTNPVLSEELFNS